MRSSAPVYTNTYTFARVVDRQRAFDLKAGFYHAGDYCEGHETVEFDTVYKARDNRALLRRGYVPKPPDQKLSEWRTEFRYAAGCDPYDDWVSNISGLKHPGPGQGIEKTLLNYNELVRTEDGVGGILKSFWKRNRTKDLDFRIEIEFSKAYEMMPVRFEIIANNMDYWEKSSIDWRPHGKHLLPYRIQYAGNGVPPRSHVIDEYVLRFFWAVGDEVPDSVFTSEDHLATLLAHFELADVVIEKDKTTYVPRELPEDLYLDVKK